jgi:DUF4097 and DUF4098 domain-containing protein YvlB
MIHLWRSRFHACALHAVVAFAITPVTACAQQTDTTITAQPNARVQIRNFAGSIKVRTWDRNTVHVVAPTRRKDDVRIQATDAEIDISAVGRSGPSAPLDFEITVPSRASLDIGGTYTVISVEGSRGSVSATTVQGDVTLRGGDGVISLKSVEGSITVQDAIGRVEVNGVNKGIQLRNVNGDIAAETVNGSITLDGIESSDVDAETVNGRVTYSGAIRDRGRYRFATHTGAVFVSIPETSNATIAATTYQGTFSSKFGMPNEAPDSGANPRRRANFAMGNGSARVEVESFQGNIVLARPGDTPDK